MSDFFKKFLAEDIRKLGANSPRQAFLAAFGKHPGWDDHVEDLGLETESLIYAKTLLYVQGIGGQIDAGAWEKLDSAQQLSSFKHIFLWQRGQQLILGRMWSSRDGKGRTRYPMIVCVHCAGVPVEWALAYLSPLLEQIEQACVRSDSAAEVRAILDRYRGEIRNAIAKVDPAATSNAVTASVVSEFVSHPSLGPEKEGWFRILYQMHSQMAAFANGKFKAASSGPRAQQIRVPAAAQNPEQALLLWSRFFQSQFDPAVPLLYKLSLEQPWLDVTAGEPASQELFCLRASSKAMPLATEVPYNLEPAFREQARAQVAAFAGDTAMKARPVVPQSDGPSAVPGGSRLKLLRWLGGSAVILAVAAIAVVSFSGKRRTPADQVAAVSSVPTSAPPANSLAPDDAAAAKLAEAVKLDQANRARLEAERSLAEAKADADTRARAELAARAKAEAEAMARAKAEEKARELALAMAAEKRRQAEEQARARAETEARAKLEAEARAKAEADARARADAEARAKVEQPKPLAPVIASAPLAAPRESVPKPSSPAPGARHITNHLGLELVLIPEIAGPDGFWVGKYEVTQAEYEKLMGQNPSKHTGNPRRPVDSVTWEQAKAFCDKLTDSERASGSLPPGFAYDLPTQKQWDLLVADATFERAVTSHSATREAPEIVGSVAANRHGLHDILGNLWEWCADGPSSQEKILRGGAYNNQKFFRFKPLNPATLHKMAPAETSHDVGFRCVMGRRQ